MSSKMIIEEAQTSLRGLLFTAELGANKQKNLRKIKENSALTK